MYLLFTSHFSHYLSLSSVPAANVAAINAAFLSSVFAVLLTALFVIVTKARIYHVSVFVARITTPWIACIATSFTCMWFQMLWPFDSKVKKCIHISISVHRSSFTIYLTFFVTVAYAIWEWLGYLRARIAHPFFELTGFNLTSGAKYYKIYLSHIKQSNHPFLERW